jgi:hypothetical protein
MTRLVPALLGTALLLLGRGACAGGESHDVTYDANTDFKALRTFAIRDGRVNSTKPEFANRLFRQRMERDIRAALISRGLKESAGTADVVVTYSLVDTDVAGVERIPPTRVPDTAASRGFVIPGGPQADLYTEGTLVIDLSNAAGKLIWRGTWSERERSTPNLSSKLSDDVRKLLREFPPKRKQGVFVN